MTALHRSKLFWLGLFGLVFLLWAWKDSRNDSAVILWQSKAMGFSASHSGSLIHLGRVNGGMAYSRPDKRFHLQRNHLKTRSPWFQRFQLYDVRSPAGLSQSVAIPYWAIVAIHLVAWILALLWQRRWLHKALSGSVTTDAGLPQRSPADS